jgi:hypothetical protein
MKFNCGETLFEKVERTKEWHDWFAWRPVRVASHDCRWLETVERRLYWCYGDPYSAEYRAKEKK